jgi:hypothetical protein
MSKTAREWFAPAQLSLLADPIDAQFNKFHHSNPHVYKQLVDLAFQWKRAGHDICSIDLLINKLRWEIGIRSTGDQFAISNNFASRYSRLIEANEPELADFFTKRMLKTSWA